jgi:hypothetical protein
MWQVIWPIVFGIAGLLVGWIYFAIMRRSVARFTERRGGVMQFTGLVLVRAALVVGGAVGAALVSTWSVIAYLAAFLVIRTVVVAAARREPPLSGAQEQRSDD